MIEVGILINVGEINYKVIRLLGKGKGGYSYLVEANNELFVLKQIHHEPCDYYQFGNKIEAEINDYERILQTKVRMPKLIYVDKNREIIIKEYIEGPTIADLIKEEKDVSIYIKQLREMLPSIYKAGLNIDYYPTNFVVCIESDQIYYIDYECNSYDPKWDFDNWGLQYWLNKNNQN